MDEPAVLGTWTNSKVALLARGAPPRDALGSVFAGEKRRGVTPSSLRQSIVGAYAHTSATVTFQ